jgi:elongation factor 1-beta
MTTVAVKIKIMPEAPDSNLEEIQNQAKETLEKSRAQNISFTQEEIAFGLKAILAKFAWPEAQETEIIETEIAKIPHVSSVQITDYRRAFG